MDDTDLMPECEQELKNLLTMVKKESEWANLKLNMKQKETNLRS